MLSEIVWWMLMSVVERCLRDVWETFVWCWEMFERCLRDVFEWFCEMFEDCWGDVAWVLLGMLKAVERCFSSVNSLTALSQTSLTLPLPQQSLNNSFQTLSQHYRSLSNLSTVAQQSLNKHSFLLLSLNSISKLSLSLSLSLSIFSQHSRNKPIPSSIPSSFQQNSHRPLCQVVFWMQSPYVILGKQVNTCMNHS